MNTASHFAHSPCLQFRHSTTFPIIVIKRPTQKEHLLPLHNSTNSRPSATPTGLVNLVVHLKTAILSNCLNSALYQFFSPYCMEIHPPKSYIIKFQWSRNYGHQLVCHRTPVTETSCQRYWNSRDKLSHQNTQRQQGHRSMGGFSDLKGNQTPKPPRKFGLRMPSVERCWRWSHSWHNQS